MEDLKAPAMRKIRGKEDQAMENQQKYFDLEEIGVSEDRERYHQGQAADNTIPAPLGGGAVKEVNSQPR